MKLESPFKSKMPTITSTPCQDSNWTNKTSMATNRSTAMSEKTSSRTKSTKSRQRRRSDP